MLDKRLGYLLDTPSHHSLFSSQATMHLNRWQLLVGLPLKEATLEMNRQLSLLARVVFSISVLDIKVPVKCQKRMKVV